MKFVCARNNIEKAVSIVERATSGKASLPVLSGIQVEATGSELILTATDLEIGMECRIPAAVEIEGRAVLESKYLSQIVRKCEFNEVSLELDPDRRLCTIVCGHADFKLHSLDTEDFPELPEVAGGIGFRTSQPEFKQMIRQVGFAAASEDPRPYLNGVYLEIYQEGMVMVATDVNRLAYRQCPTEELGERKGAAIIPASTLMELGRVISGEGGELDGSIGEAQVEFRIPGVRVFSRLIEGRYPNYRQVIPQHQDNEIVVSRSGLLGAVERASLVSKAGNAVTVFVVEGDMVTVKARETQVGEAKEEIPAELGGKPGQIAFQSRFLVDFLRAVDEESISITFQDELGPSCFRPVNDNSYLCVIMPVKVS